MSLFWNQEREPDYGRMLRSSRKTPDDALLRFDGKWAEINTLTDADVLSMNSVDIAGVSGLDIESFNSILADSLGEWRQNPARSFINVVAQANQAVENQPMFSDLLRQTLVLGGLCRVARDQMGHLGGVPDPNSRVKYIRLSHNCTAITALPGSEEHINNLARGVRIWEMRNAALVRSGKVKAPKRLYRGVRGANIKVPGDPGIERDGRPHEQFAADWTQARFDYMTSAPIADVFFSPILSFSANEDVARYFANGEGFIVGVDPTEVEIVSCFKLDEALDQKDYVSKRHEREWIIRLKPEAVIPKADVDIYDADWLMVQGDYRGIALAGHSAYARYEMGGHRIKAEWIYRPSGVGGSVQFTIDREWGLSSRADVKKRYGFDPIPQAADQVTNLEFYDYDRHSYGRGKPHRKMNVLPEPEPAFGMKI